ncbi:MAG: efflux RND transporter periplasmic adaptor subunit [Paracoccaceae bacterium]
MWFLKQLVGGLIICAAALAIWIYYVPSAAPWLERFGVYEALGLEPEEVEDDEGGGGRGFGMGATRVVAEPVRMDLLNGRLNAIGDGRALRSVTLRAEATGRVAEIGFSAGSRVEADDIVLRLDDEAERIALERARLTQSNAREDLDRLARLEGSGTVSAVAMREAELGLRTAELAVRQAEYDLSRRVIRAPIPGWIGLYEVEQGDRLGAGDAIATITDRSEILIDFRVPQRAVGQIAPGMPIEARALALEDVTLTGEISAIDNVIDRASRTLRVQGRLENEGDRLRDGMAFQVTLAFPGEELPSVDPLAVQWSADGSFVWAVEDGKARRVPVRIRQRDATAVLVEADLAEGDLVIIEGVQTLRPGAQVQVVDGTAISAAGRTEGL